VCSESNEDELSVREDELSFTVNEDEPILDFGNTSVPSRYYQGPGLAWLGFRKRGLWEATAVLARGAPAGVPLAVGPTGAYRTQAWAYSPY
jgi:hypothetical protein